MCTPQLYYLRIFKHVFLNSWKNQNLPVSQFSGAANQGLLDLHNFYSVPCTALHSSDDVQCWEQYFILTMVDPDFHPSLIGLIQTGKKFALDFKNGTNSRMSSLRMRKYTINKFN